MKRIKTHVIEAESQNLLRSNLPPEWILREVPKDYGVDFEVEIVDGSIVSGNRIWLQLKGVEKFKASQFELGGVHFVKYVVETKLLQYALTCPFPLLLFLADLNTKEIYWLPLQVAINHCLKSENQTWELQKFATLKIPCDNRLNIEQGLNYIGLRWFALEPARMYAFSRLHNIYMECQYKANLSGYDIGDGIIYPEGTLEKGLTYISQAITEVKGMEVLFGKNGIKNFIDICLPSFHEALDAIKTIRQLLKTKNFNFRQMAFLLEKIQVAIQFFSSVSRTYSVLTEQFIM